MDNQNPQQPQQPNQAPLNPIEQLIQQYTGQPAPVEETPQPSTFVIECNKAFQMVIRNSSDKPKFAYLNPELFANIPLEDGVCGNCE